MPIKLPKALGRRKASVHGALEEVEDPPSSSFRVLDRRELASSSGRPGRSASKSFDGAAFLKRSKGARPLSSPEALYDNNIFAGLPSKTNSSNRASAGTSSTAPASGLYDSSSSSARYSSTSTLPSSMDEKNATDAHKKPFEDVPVPSIPHPEPAFSFRAGRRTFSFGMKSTKSHNARHDSSSEDPKLASPDQKTPRDRGMTNSSYASTATPPKLSDADLPDIASVEIDGFSNMFENFGKRGSRVLTQDLTAKQKYPQSDSLSPTESTHSYSSPIPTIASLQKPVPPVHDRSLPLSPQSWTSHNSNDRLILTASPGPSEKMFGNNTETLKSPQRIPHARSMPSPGGRDSNANVYSHARMDSTISIQNEDAGLLSDPSLKHESGGSMLKSVTAVGYRPNGVSRKAAGFFENDGESANWKNNSNQTTPRPARSEPRTKRADTDDEFEDTPLIDESLLEHVRVASEFEAVQSGTNNQNGGVSSKPPKIMTREQFEQYRRQEESTRPSSRDSKSSASESGSDTYDDEDDTERNREAVRQRAKQEAHLSIYRQQMMKLTGEQSKEHLNGNISNPSLVHASMSAPNLISGRTSSSFERSSDNKTKVSDEDEDEDVPLGILAAHGFPNKNRPPQHLGSTAPHMRLSIQPYPAPPVSTAGDQVPAGLPVFARNLPQDPYYGASLVNQANRESMAFGAGAQPRASMAGVPGGLVGVIASEERAKAMRRGSPNKQAILEAQGPFTMPAMPVDPGMGTNGRAMSMGNVDPMIMQMPMVTTPSFSPKDQAQIEMSQQMTQMMAMQVQWMQHMMAMQGIQTSQIPTPRSSTPNLLAPPQMQNRPMSMTSSTPLYGSQPQQRSMSMMGTPHPQWPGAMEENINGTHTPSIAGTVRVQGGYASSIAPSERNNVGMPPRYRPVSLVPPEGRNSRASTFTAGTLQNWQDKDKMRPTATIRQIGGDAEVKPTNMRNVTASNRLDDDDDDDRAWEEMRKKRDKKKSAWKLKKAKNNKTENNPPENLEELMGNFVVS